MSSFYQYSIVKKILIYSLFMYLGIFVFYGADRYFHRHHTVLSSVEYSHPIGYGHQEIQIFNLTLIKPIEPFNLPDFLTATFLFITGISTFLVFCVLHVIPKQTDHKTLMLLFSFGFWYLCFDELFQVHEFIGLNLAYYLYNLEGIELLDKDFNGHIILLYAMVALLVLIKQHRFFWNPRLAFGILCGGFLLHGFAAVIDFMWNKNLYLLKKILGPLGFLVHRDEFFEMTAAFLYMIAFMLYAIRVLADHYVFKEGSYLLINNKE